MNESRAPLPKIEVTNDGDDSKVQSSRLYETGLREMRKMAERNLRSPEDS